MEAKSQLATWQLNASVHEPEELGHDLVRRAGVEGEMKDQLPCSPALLLAPASGVQVEPRSFVTRPRDAHLRGEIARAPVRLGHRDGAIVELRDPLQELSFDARRSRVHDSSVLENP
jgi:hypothetical protein